jgi:predicted cupin superfamily sugar epimerase
MRMDTKTGDQLMNEKMMACKMNRSEELKSKYNLERHPEGGWFSEVYTSPFDLGGRAFMGSIYFLLEGEDISHFHQIDCDEIWYHHEGSALKITMLTDGKLETCVIGQNSGQTAMAVIPKGAIFAAENVEKDGYCFMSCATTPRFSYDGFRLVDNEEISRICPSEFEKIKHLAFEKAEIEERKQ